MLHHIYSILLLVFTSKVTHFILFLIIWFVLQCKVSSWLCRKQDERVKIQKAIMQKEMDDHIINWTREIIATAEKIHEEVEDQWHMKRMIESEDDEDGDEELPSKF